MKQAAIVWSAALALCLLTGCAPSAREPDGLELAQVLGVDGGTWVTLTAVCGGADSAKMLLGSASGADLDTARQMLPWTGERELALTNLSYIIIGKDADLEEVLTYVLADRELSPAASVWWAENAAELLDACGDPVSRLAVLTERGCTAPSAVQALAGLKATGSVTLPVLTVKSGQLETAGEILWEESS